MPVSLHSTGPATQNTKEDRLYIECTAAHGTAGRGPESRTAGKIACSPVHAARLSQPALQLAAGAPGCMAPSRCW